MDTLRDLIRNIREINGAYQVAAIAVVAAVVVVFISPIVAIGILIVALSSFLFGIGMTLRTPRFETPAINPARGTLYAAADPHLPHDRPSSVTDLEWIIFRHLKTENIALGKSGDIPARFFIDLREAALLPEQCEVLTTLLCNHIRQEISVETHHAVVIPKSGNVNLGMAVASELGLAPILVRDWPFYGRWIETLLASGRGILVDDVSARGEILVESAEHVREAGFIVTRAFLLIQRSEGNADDHLEHHRLSLSAVYTMSDVELEELVSRVRRAGASGPVS